MNKFWVIASDVYKKNVKSVSFFIMLLVPFIIGGLAYAGGQFASRASDVDKIAIVSDQQELAEAMAQTANEAYKFVVLDSQADAEKQMSEEKIDAFLVLHATDTTVKGELFSESSLGQATELTLQQILSSIQGSARAQQLGLTTEQVASLNQPAEFTKQKVNFDDNGKMMIGEDNSAVQYIISFGGTILLFVFIMTYAGIIAQEIASEKGTRIMEVILSSTRAQTHFYGKLFGILLVALTQMVVYAVAFAISYNWVKDMEVVKTFLANISLQAILGNFLIFTLIFVLLGIFIYAVLAALCGSLVNKAEDTSKVILPVTYLSLGGYMLGIMLGAMDPNNIVIRVTSYIPFLSSYIMPIRLANETVGIGSALISVAILIVATIALTLGCAKMYKSNVLVYNDNGILATLKQSFRLMKSQN
ncbi:ABC-2 type transport system permease [Enterococcus sp. DIV2402]|uniref:ABC-2 type transport system permease n=1 Tax=Candidatus Enterococcus lowellii TaxID=2230877 RepID=A0ABZ2SLE5_9ENTE|nr:ABC transporter permease [Enterococcus sp. DIV2402]MBO0464504.1 ABC transporter permease [Enterococcus sp. DIV2402]